MKVIRDGDAIDGGLAAYRFRSARLASVGLSAADHAAGVALQRDVIAPAVAGLTKRLPHSPLAAPAYVQSLGVNFESGDYFQGRFDVARLLRRQRVPLSAVHGLVGRLHQELLRLTAAAVPNQLPDLASFLARILALDASLVADIYTSESRSTVGRLRVEADQWRRVASTDGLTGLATRGHTLAVLEAAIRELNGSGSPLCVVMADLDHFKNINDTYGHQTGDDILRRVAKLFQRLVRKSDCVGRYGGEEFLWVLPRASLLEGVRLAERIRSGVAAEPWEVDGQKLALTASLGITETVPGDDIRAVVGRADDAMYDAKRMGRNSIVVRSGHYRFRVKERRIVCPG